MPLATCTCVTWCWWHHQWHNAFLMSKWLTWCCSMSFLLIYCLWHWHGQHVMLMVLSMSQLHFLGQDDWKEVQHDFSGHNMPLALTLTSHYAISNVKATTPFLMPIKQNKEQHDFLVMWHNFHHHCHHMMSVVGWCLMMPLATVSIT